MEVVAVVKQLSDGRAPKMDEISSKLPECCWAFLVDMPVGHYKEVGNSASGRLFLFLKGGPEDGFQLLGDHTS